MTILITVVIVVILLFVYKKINRIKCPHCGSHDIVCCDKLNHSYQCKDCKEFFYHE